jgi:Carboxypeptidase regulatory-like domain/TonB-dependent Receptor Plug Domain
MVSRPAVRAWSTAFLSLLLGVAAASHATRAQQPDSARRDSLPATLIGRVTDTLGAPLNGAEITLFKSESIRAISGDSGEFRLTGLPPGTNVFNVRRLGYQPASFTAALKSGRTHRATFALSISAQALPLIAVSDTARTHWLDQFERRRSTSRGTFITRAEIVKRTARMGSDIVRTVPGVRVIPGRSSGVNQVIMNRGAGGRPCIPTMYVHNMPYSGVLDDFSADDIEALEVYVGISEIPPELDKNGRGICGVIVVWTRDPKKPG